MTKHVYLDACLHIRYLHKTFPVLCLLKYNKISIKNSGVYKNFSDIFVIYNVSNTTYLVKFKGTMTKWPV